MTEKIVQLNKNLLTIHFHPNSFPPSVMDLNGNYLYEYSIGIIVRHDGKIYMYEADEYISVDYYNLSVAEYSAQGYNVVDAQILALSELQEKFAVKIKEITGNDV